MTRKKENKPNVLVLKEQDETYSAWLSDSYRVLTSNNPRQAASRITNLDPKVVLIGDEMVSEGVVDAIRDSECRVGLLTHSHESNAEFDKAFDIRVVEPTSKEELLEVVEQLAKLSSYDKEIQEMYNLAARRAMLDIVTQDTELKEKSEYEKIESNLLHLREKLENTVNEFDNTDFATAFRGLVDEEEENEFIKAFRGLKGNGESDD